MMGSRSGIWARRFSLEARPNVRSQPFAYSGVMGREWMVVLMRC